MLLTNLTLALGLMTTSAVGGVTTIQTYKIQNNYLAATTDARIGNDNLLVPKSLNDLWHDIHLELGMKDFLFTDEDNKTNIQFLTNYLNLNDASIGRNVGLLNTHKETNYVSNDVESQQYSFINESDNDQSFIIPARSYWLTSTASWDLKMDNSRAFNAKIKFFWGDQQINLDLSKHSTTYSELEEVLNYPTQSFKVQANKEALITEGIINNLTVYNGSVTYPLYFNPNIMGVRYVWHEGPNQFVGIYNLKESLRSLLDQNFFNPNNDDVFLYENNEFFYNIPLTWTATRQDINTTISINDIL